MSGIVFGPVAERLFRLEAPTAVSAGAGSGKTTALVELCLRLLDGSALGTPCAPGELAAITFTEKAAAELEDRLRAAVAARARAAAEASPGSDEARAWLERLHALDRMAVGTIHGFCGRVLREHAPEAGLDPDFTVLDEERTSGWIAAAAQAAVVAALDAGRVGALALAAASGAGAGRGGLPALVASLLRERATRGASGPVPPAPADEAAAGAARARLLAAAGALLAARAAAVTAGARALVDAVARGLAALSPEARDGPLAPGALHALAALGEAARGRRVLKADGPALREARDALTEAAAELVPLAADVLAGPQKGELARLVEEAEARYVARKAAARAVDFDDLLLRARDLLRAEAGLRDELRGRLRALLVDEYQDVNPVQQEVFELLAPGAGPQAARVTGTAPAVTETSTRVAETAPAVTETSTGVTETSTGVTETSTAGPVLVAVGDLKQSIYRFRGADVAVFARLIRRMEAGAGRVLHLADNHRSAPAVLDLVNEVSGRALQPPPGGPPRDDELRFDDRDRLVPTRAEAARPACELLVDTGAGSAAERRAREAMAIAARIGALLAGAAGDVVRERTPDGERPRRPRAGDVAVLFRRLTQLAPYERALRAAGIPYRLARGGGFYQAPEVRDAGELLAAVADPDDALAWAAVLRSPACALSDGALLLLSRVGLTRLHALPPASLDDALARLAGPDALSEAERGRLARLLAAYRALRAVRDRLPLDALLSRAVEALDLDAALLAGPDGERRASNLEKLLGIAADLAADGCGPGELARHLRALAARPPREPEAELEAGDAVALLSIHQAKGLEWPIAFVPDLGARPRVDTRRAVLDREGRLCAALLDAEREEAVETASLHAAREDDRRAASAESRRLLYVALTRARDLLVLSGEGSGAETWRGLVEAALAARPDLARRVPLAEAGGAGPLAARAMGDTLLAPSSVAAGTADGTPLAPLTVTFAEERAPSPTVGAGGDTRDVPLAPAAVTAAGERVPALLRPPRLAGPPPPTPVRIAVTELAEYARCPRRHHLGHVLGLQEPRGMSGAPAADDPGRATARGTLAHAMLAEVDLGAPPLERRAQLAAAAARRGYDPASPGVRPILAELARFADSAGGRALAQAARDGRLTREVPFLLRLDPEPSGAADRAPAAYLVGAIDALVRERRGDGLTVVDYKYSTPRADAAERYRLQLLVYLLAAGRAHPGARVRARLQFLRGDHRSVDVTPSPSELARFALVAPRLAAEARRGAGDRPPDALGRDEAGCRAAGCGWVARCFRRPAVV